MKQEKLDFCALGGVLKSTRDDLAETPKKDLKQIVFAARLIRNFEEKLTNLQKQGQLWGALHTSIGMEFAAASALQTLGVNSKINSTHRGHHHVVAKGLFHYKGPEWDPTSSFGEGTDDKAFIDFLRKVFAEILGLKDGLCSGRGGSMHLYDPSVGIHGTNGIVGGALPAAAGLAFGALQKGKGEIVMTFFGDGASNQGTFHETCNIAKIYNLPIVFFIENNQYAVGTKAEDVCAGSNLASRGIPYGLVSYQVMADDPLAIRHAVLKSMESINKGGPPALIEVIGYRPMHHDSPLPGSSYGYRTKEEEAEWEKKNCYDLFPQALVDEKIITQEDLDKIDNNILKIIEESLATILEEGEDVIKSSMWPKIEQELRPGFGVVTADNQYFQKLPVGIRSNQKELQDIEYLDDTREYEEVELSYVNSIARVTGRWLEKDPSVFVWGEDVANFGQGPYGASKGLIRKFPGRIINTPISESGFVGMSLGAAMNGIKPIVEIMFPDFVFVAADQFFNQIGKARYMYGSDLDLPIVVRTRIATGTGMGPQHSMDPTALFAQFPGWRIIAPSNGKDYIGLFNTAMISRDPVLILEHNTLYRKNSKIPKDNLDYCIPFGKAKVVKEGTMLTAVAYGGMVEKVLAASEKLKDKISIEVVDLRSLDFPSIDYQTIVESVAKTGDLIICEESQPSQGIGGHIIYNVLQHSGLSLDKIPGIATSIEVPMPVSKVLEESSILSEEDIIEFVKYRRGL